MRSVALLALLFAAGALADDRDSASGGASAPRPEYRHNEAASRALFDRLDKNRDGYLTGSELTTPEALAANWVSVDRDGDGRIARSEFAAVNGAGVASTRRP